MSDVVDDLDDVVVTSPLPYADIDFGSDSYHARKIINHLGLSAPWTRESILDFLQFQAELKDQLSVAEKIETFGSYNQHGKFIPSVDKSKLTASMREFIAMQVAANTPSAIIRAEIKRIWGVEVSPSHMSHMRKRVFKKGTNL